MKTTKHATKLRLDKQTVRTLASMDLSGIIGGSFDPNLSFEPSCQLIGPNAPPNGGGCPGA